MNNFWQVVYDVYLRRRRWEKAGWRRHHDWRSRHWSVHLVAEYVGDLHSDFLFFVFTCWNPSWLEVGWNMAGLQTWWGKEIKNFLNNNKAPSQLLQREEEKTKIKISDLSPSLGGSRTWGRS